MGDWCPALAPGILLRYDQVRETDLLVMPERVVVLNAEAAEIVRLCDGTREVVDIAAEFPVEEDVVEFLERVRAEGWLR